MTLSPLRLKQRTKQKYYLHDLICIKKGTIRDHQQQDHNGAPANFKIKVLSKHPDPMSRVIAEAMNIKNHTDKGLKNLNSKAEYHQAPIVRTSRQVTVGL